MRTPVSSIKPIWFDAQNVDDQDLTLEQDYNDQIQSGIINNHFGTGVLPDALVKRVLFNSDAANGLLDGKAVNAQLQPTDTSYGNQLEVELSNSKAAGKKAVKVLVIGLDFQNNLQYDRFTFHRNEKQLSSKHYKIILTILFNDLTGLESQSFNLGGQIIIREASPLSLSRDCIMISQDVEPNLFFRDFFVSSGGTLANVLAAALPSYNIDALNISVGYKQLRSLVENDVVSQLGQKFLADTNNIQKITLLMSVINNSDINNLVWTGDLIVSIYQLQSTLSCPTDIVPGLAIDFDPSNIPLAQLSINYSSLLDNGIKLNTVPQPVDFIFSNTPVGSGLVILPGSYYVVSMKRAGSADTCQIQLATGNNSSDISRETLFNGSIWVDIPEEALWYQIWTDAAKVSDGQAYDAGHGIQVPKTIIDANTALTIDYSLNQIQFVRNDLYYALVQAITTQNTPVQDERTGNPINSRQQYSPSISLLNTAALSNIVNVSDPLIIGTISDQNIKSFSLSNSTISAKFHEYGMVENQLVLKIITDTTDGYRYDQNIIELLSELVNGTLNGAKIIPNISNPNLFYRIAEAELLTMKYGDINGDGIIDANDLLLAESLIGSDLNFMPSYTGYVSSTSQFVSDNMISWQVVDSMSNVLASGTDGILNVNPLDGSLANFQSSSALFNSIPNIGSCKLVILTSNSTSNIGSFIVSNLIDANNITIRKILYTSETILQIMRGDISGDMVLNSTDFNYISNYINAVQPFPATSSPANNVGKTFKAIRLTLEEYVDRNDDYPSIDLNRFENVHTNVDPYLDGYTAFSGTNLKNNPISFTVVKQLIWDPSSVVVNSNPKLVPAAFGYQSGFIDNSCGIDPTISDVFPKPNTFDPGRNDFFIPNNLIIGDGGQFLRSDGYFMKVDLEVSTILIEVPDVPFDKEYNVNLLTDFIADYSGDGFTRLNYPASRFSDCSTVSLNALLNNQLRFNVALQSFSPQLNGLDPDCVSGIIIDGKIGVSMDYSTGLLTLNFANLYQDPVKQTLNTKITITAYIKKAGWNNTPIFVNSVKMQNILGIPTPTVPSIDCPTPPIVIIS